MTSTATTPRPGPASTGVDERRAHAAPRPRPALGELPPPSGPRLDAAGPFGGGGPVDWWAWQARVRAASGAGRVPVRSAPTGRRARWRTVALVAGVGALVAGGLAVVGRGAGPTPTAAADPVGIAGPTTVSATPLELVGVTDLPAPEPPAPVPTAESPAPAPTPEPAVVRVVGPVDRLTLDLRAPDGRAMPTVVRLPVDGGPFPLVVFAHGYASGTAVYGPLLDDLAAAGYVVAAPELPGTSTASPEPVGDRDPAGGVDDLRGVVTAVLAEAASDGPLHGAVRDGAVAVVGHSDGGITAAATAFASRVRDPRVGAAVVLSGALGGFGGSWFPAGSPPLLAVHGDADDVNPFASSQSLFAADGSGASRYLVRVRDGGHLDAFLGDRTRGAVVALVDDFLRGSLGTDADATGRIPADASVPGVLDLLGR